MEAQIKLIAAGLALFFGGFFLFQYCVSLVKKAYVEKTAMSRIIKGIPLVISFAMGVSILGLNLIRIGLNF